MDNFKFIDLFAGIGGFHLALEQLGGECVLMSEIDEKCQRVYRENFPQTQIEGDIHNLNNSNSEDPVPEHDVLCAGFPCQPFSKAGKRLGLEDTRGTLFYEIAKIIERKRPEYLMLENVPNLIGHNHGQTLLAISNVLEDLGYVFSKTPLKFSPHLLGVPQIRERVFILAKNTIDFNHSSACYVKRPKPAICSIEDILQSENEIDNIGDYSLSQDEIDRVNMWNDFINGIQGTLPGFPVWADQFREKYNISELPKWKRNFLIKNWKLYNDNKDHIDAWLAKYNNLEHLKQTHTKFEWQANDAERDLWKLIFHFRPSGMRVKKPDYFPALVAITQTSVVGKFKRRITPREAARLQSFPDTFEIHPIDKIAYKQFGNAVNVDVVKYLCVKLMELSSYDLEVTNSIPQTELFKQ